MTQRTLYTALVLVVAAGLGGCASTSEMDSLRAQVEQAQAAADAAAASADAAAQEAAAAKALAAEANATAAAAKAQSEMTEEKIDRMFKKTMYK